MLNKTQHFSIFERITVIAILIVCLEPPIFTLMPSLSNVDLLCDIGRVVVLGLSIFHFINHRNFIYKSNYIFVAIFILFLEQLLMTLAYSGNVKTAFSSFATICGGCYFLCYFLTKNKSKTSSILCNYMIVLCALNLFSQVFFKNGLFIIENNGALYRTSKFYFLGNENDTIPFALLCSFLCLYLFYDRKKKIYLFLNIVPILTILLADSVTSKIGMIIFLVLSFVFLFIFRKPFFHFRFKLIDTIFVASLLLMLFLSFYPNISFLSSFFENVLHKDITFTGRTDIWRLTMTYFWEKPLLGHGLMNTEDLYLVLTASHQHNYYLHILFQGGLFSFAVFLYIINHCRKAIRNCENYYLTIISSFALFSFFIIFIAESYDDNLYCLPFYFLVCFVDIVALAQRKQVFFTTKVTNNPFQLGGLKR